VNYKNWTLNDLKDNKQVDLRSLMQAYQEVCRQVVERYEGHVAQWRTLAILLRGSHHARNLEHSGTTLDQSALNEVVMAENWASAEALITDDIVRRHAASGGQEQVRRRFAAYRATGLDEIIVSGARDGSQLASTFLLAGPNSIPTGIDLLYQARIARASGPSATRSAGLRSYEGHNMKLWWRINLAVAGLAGVWMSGLALAAHILDFDMGVTLGDGPECRPGLDRLKLLGIADQDELGAAPLSLAEDPFHLARADHAGFIDHQHVPIAEKLAPLRPLMLKAGNGARGDSRTAFEVLGGNTG
jgi:hypothetical protein